MRGLGIIVLLLALLAVGLLVIRDYHSGPSGVAGSGGMAPASKKALIDQSKKAARAMEDAMQSVKDAGSDP